MKQADVRRADGSLVCRAEVADSLLTRGRGLLGRRGLGPEEGLLIRPCSSVHTFFMAFPIDVVYLDAEQRVVKTATLPAFRFSFGGRGAKNALELPAGRAGDLGVGPGETFTIETV